MFFGPTNLLPNAIADLFVDSTMTHSLNAFDRHALRSAILKGNLNDDEVYAIDRLLYSVRRGRIRMSDR